MKNLPASLLLLICSASVCAQSAPVTTSTPPSQGLYAWWSARTNAIQSKQPAWPPPLVTTYIGLFQVVRTDIVRQIAPARTDTWNFDNSKGFNLIPSDHTEIDINLPPYIEHNTTAVDGWGDFSVLGKYRLASGNKQHGTYVVSAWVLATFPTGTYKNGSTKPSLATSIGLGKPNRDFAYQLTKRGFVTLSIGSPGGEHLAGIDDVGVIADAERLAYVMVCDEHPDGARFQEAHNPLDLDHRDRIDPGKWLIEQDEAR